ncbi:peptidoglycan DD-metalloendopeptidase family protein [Actinokineospora sp. NPDC004072]
MSRTPIKAALAAAAVGAALVVAMPSANAAPDLPTAVRTAMLDRQGPSTLSTAREPLVEPTRSAGNWVFGSTTIPLSATDEHQSPKMALFIAHRDRGRWQVELDGTEGFVRLASKAPVLSDGEKRTFASNYAGSQAAAATDTGLGLPWARGVAWWMGGGPHGHSGSSRPFNSIDFNGGDGRVLSAGPGRVYKSCVRGRSALVKVVHDNGWSTTYYHMYNLTTLADGSAVNTGTYLGNIGNELPCGGSSSGAHVHFSLLRGTTEVSVHGKTFGGWTFYEGSAAYGGYAERGGTRVYPGNGRVTNYGPSDSNPGYPTGTVDAGTNTSVNLRSGPGLNYAVVGQAADGAVISIACTSRGGTVEGPLGPDRPVEPPPRRLLDQRRLRQHRLERPGGPGLLRDGEGCARGNQLRGRTRLPSTLMVVPETRWARLRRVSSRVVGDGRSDSGHL